MCRSCRQNDGGIMTCDPFTNEELDKLYDLVRTEHEEVMCGDWDSVKDEISRLHLLMHKILVLQGEAK